MIEIECAAPGCERPSVATIYCSMHYQRFRKYGDPLGGGPFLQRGGWMLRFSEKYVVGKESECWEWTGARNSDGYGSLNIAGRATGAHCIAYQVAKGDIPSGMVVRHTCDNPPCVNPAHLLLGTIAQNVDDSIIRGRMHRKLSDSDVAKIRTAVRTGPRGTAAALARSYGVTPSLIAQIKSGTRRDTTVLERALRW